MPQKAQKGPVLLMILDGWGRAPRSASNAIKLANPKNYFHYYNNYPRTILGASEEYVGLSKGVIGSSEVGHMNIGAGRIVYQNLLRINRAIKDGSFQKNKAFLSAINHAKKKGTALHLIGLMSKVGVHAHMDHCYALMKMAKKAGLKKIWLHFISDGRDTRPGTAKPLMHDLEKNIKKYGGKVATVGGRYYVMDRDNRWDRIKKAFDVIVHGKGDSKKSGEAAIADSFKEGITDEFILPVRIGEYAGMEKDDAMIFFNYRIDRTRQFSQALTERNFKGFKAHPPKIAYSVMTKYYEGVKAQIAFPPNRLKNILGEVVSKKGKKQLRIAETEKYPHVTFFFNGAEDRQFKGEDRVCVPSPKVATYDLQPEMSIEGVTKKLCTHIKKGTHDMIILNFANPDMVGHTGSIPAVKKAVKAVDIHMKKVIDLLLEKDGVALITADHGNADKMLDHGKPWTAHSLSKVNLIVVGNNVHNYKLMKEGVLGNIAPTILDLMGIKQPKEMSCESLILKR